MRYIRYAFLAALAVCLVTVALANRGGAVTLHLLPEGGLTGFLGFSWSVTLPLFIIIFGAIIAGVLIGFVWEWLREHKHRAEGARAKRSAAALEREVKAIKTPESKTGDDVLALLEEAR